MLLIFKFDFKVKGSQPKQANLFRARSEKNSSSKIV